jgi:hypothetical protein
LSSEQGQFVISTEKLAADVELAQQHSIVKDMSKRRRFRFAPYCRGAVLWGPAFGGAGPTSTFGLITTRQPFRYARRFGAERLAS